MPEPTPNLPLLRKVLDYVDAHPEKWRQQVYVAQTTCGTVACIAGWACLLNGDTPLWNRDHPLFVRRADAGGRSMAIGDRATDLLGITSGEATCLFYCDNTRADVQRHAEDIAARAGERL